MLEYKKGAASIAIWGGKTTDPKNMSSKHLYIYVN